MTSNNEGLSPTLRPQLGVGWGRALPAAFGYDNGILPDGVNDHFSVPALQSQFYTEFTIEMWVRYVSPYGGVSNLGLFNLTSSQSKSIGLLINVNTTQRFGYITPPGSVPAIGPTLVVGNTYHIVLYYSLATLRVGHYVNGGLLNGGTNSEGTLPDANGMTDFANVHIFRNGTAYGPPNKYDEIRIYNRIITQEEVTLNYNSGVGNNPCRTEGLKLWLQFQQAEAPNDLYPGGVPAGWSAGAWGIRDMSGNGNHAMQVNQSNNSTLGGNIQPF